MKIQFIGDGTASKQTFCYPGGTLEKWQSITATELPGWLSQAAPGTFLIDGKLLGKQATKPPRPAAKPEIKPAAKE